MIYDIVIGKTLPTKYNYNYIQNIYTNRINQENDITTYSELVDIISFSLKEAFSKLDAIVDVLDNVITEFGLLKARMAEDESLADVRIRELLSALAFSGIEFYLIRRPDLTSEELDDSSTRAYMLDKQDSFFPSLNRVMNGYSLVFDDKKDANISTVVMNFLSDIKFNDAVEDAIELNNYREKYAVLEDSHMGWALNTDPLIEFLDDYGYKFIVVVSA